MYKENLRILSERREFCSL